MSIHVNDFVGKYLNIVCILFTDMLYVYVRYSYQCELLMLLFFTCDNFSQWTTVHSELLCSCIVYE